MLPNPKAPAPRPSGYQQVAACPCSPSRPAATHSQLLALAEKVARMMSSKERREYSGLILEGRRRGELGAWQDRGGTARGWAPRGVRARVGAEGTCTGSKAPNCSQTLCSELGVLFVSVLELEPGHGGGCPHLQIPQANTSRVTPVGAAWGQLLPRASSAGAVSSHPGFVPSSPPSLWCVPLETPVWQQDPRAGLWGWHGPHLPAASPPGLPRLLGQWI